MRTTTIRTGLGVLALMLWASFAHAQAPHLLPGVLDIPVQAGSSIPDDCKWSRRPTIEGIAGCVIFPPALAIRMLNAYKSRLEFTGWTLNAEADPYFLFDHSIEGSACVLRLVVTGSVFATVPEYLEAQRTNRFEELNGVLYFQVEPEPVCVTPEPVH